jgi:hypothetical protein
MRLTTVLCLCAAAVLVTGCKTKYYYVDSGVPLGHDCPNGNECYGDSFCFEGMCTTTCQSNADCWEGTECRPLGTAAVMTCVTVRYRTGPVMVGTSCGVDPTACDGVDPECDPKHGCDQTCSSDDECSPAYRCSSEFNTCLRQLFCYARQTDDVDAVCTQECTDDRDCPPKLYCETVASDTDPNRKICLRRQFCAPCARDEECDLVGGVCGTDNLGFGFCTAPCTPAVDSSDPNYYTCVQPFSECKDNGDGRTLCHHRYGACVGDGSLCSPCRSRADCDWASGAVCYRSSWGQERFCTTVCDTTCPAGYACFEFNNNCTSDLRCRAPGGKCQGNDPCTYDWDCSGSTPTCDLTVHKCVGTCTPPNPNQCMVDYDDTCPGFNPKYPTCYPDLAGPPCP